MATKVLKLAKTLLTPKHIGITEEIVQKHLDKAMADKDRRRVRDLSEVLAFIDAVKSEEASAPED